MGLFGHHEATGGRTFKYNLEDVKTRYLRIVTNEMGASLDNKISENEYRYSCGSFRYNMNPGSHAEVSFSDTGSGINVRVRITVNQAGFSRAGTWIERSLDYLEKQLVGCKPYSKVSAEFVATNEVLVKCPNCGYSFSVDKNLTTCFCQKCGTKLVRK